MNTPHEVPATTPDPAAFRRTATVIFRLFVAALFLSAAGLAALGWWLGRGGDWPVAHWPGRCCSPWASRVERSSGP